MYCFAISQNNEARPDVDDIPSHPPPKYEPLLSGKCLMVVVYLQFNFH